MMSMDAERPQGFRPTLFEGEGPTILPTGPGSDHLATRQVFDG